MHLQQTNYRTQKTSRRIEKRNRAFTARFTLGQVNPRENYFRATTAQ